jgi:hypothetical protein
LKNSPAEQTPSGTVNSGKNKFSANREKNPLMATVVRKTAFKKQTLGQKNIEEKNYRRSVTRSQSYDRELQSQRCKFLQRQG